jgi:hypothetical protein
MKEYPSISREVSHHDLYFYCFDKLDGSQIRAEWCRKNGFYKFGSRGRLMDQNDPLLGEAVSLIQDGWAKELNYVYRDRRYDRAIAFFEFWGPNSFAGMHEIEPHQTTLIDVAPYKKGILFPKEFLDLFGHLPIAKLLHQGKVNQEFVQLVQSGQLEGMTFEGTVCKARNPKAKTSLPVMFKIKNLAWLAKLKKKCGLNLRLFEQLQ